ncbi:MAG: cytochrome b N-terminal domain-containing protein [Planctomycetaceae bacterium]|nr:cytochrome b N-terminal domain-containing protein [Planctomycetaceae bacterium]
MKTLWNWLDSRTGLGDWCGWLADTPTPGGPGWSKVWPCAITFSFCIEAITGFFLWVYYSPSTQTAWESVYYLQHQVAGGWLLRAIHHYTAHVLLAMLILFVVQTILTGACRAPRELVFWATIGLALFALAAVLTGDLLSWDQNGYSATKTRTGFLTLLPWIGDSLLSLANGGPGSTLGNLTLTRFFALHVGLFSGGFLLLLIIRGALARRVNDAIAATGGATPYWPRQAWRAGFAYLAVLAVVLLLSCQHGVKPPHAGVPTLSPADPANCYSAARPEWFLTGVFQFSQLFPSVWEVVPIFVVTGLLFCIVMVMPFLARTPLGHAFNIVFTLTILAALVGMTYASYAKDRKDAVHQKAIALEQWQADRVLALAEHQGIPPTGALTLLRNDPKTQGPRLFAQQCAGCHSHASNAYEMPEIKTETPTAPNLTDYASRQWLAGLLDPKQVNSAKYFGSTKFRGGKMAGFVKENLSELDAGEKKNLQKAIAALSAEARLPAQQELDARDAKLIEEGRKLLSSDFGCTDCHRFHGKGTLGIAPLLTGYGSPEWLAGIINNSADKQFYSKLNDRMPAYAPNADPTQNTLSLRQVQMLTDWLRGDWYEKKTTIGK